MPVVSARVTAAHTIAEELDRERSDDGRATPSPLRSNRTRTTLTASTGTAPTSVQTWEMTALRLCGHPHLRRFRPPEIEMVTGSVDTRVDRHLPLARTWGTSAVSTNAGATSTAASPCGSACPLRHSSFFRETPRPSDPRGVGVFSPASHQQVYHPHSIPTPPPRDRTGASGCKAGHGGPRSADGDRSDCSRAAPGSDGWTPGRPVGEGRPYLALGQLEPPDEVRCAVLGSDTASIPHLGVDSDQVDVLLVDAPLLATKARARHRR